MDRPTDGPADRPSYRDAWTNFVLVSMEVNLKHIQCFLAEDKLCKHFRYEKLLAMKAFTVLDSVDLRECGFCWRNSEQHLQRLSLIKILRRRVYSFLLVMDLNGLSTPILRLYLGE